MCTNVFLLYLNVIETHIANMLNIYSTILPKKNLDLIELCRTHCISKQLINSL